MDVIFPYSEGKLKPFLKMTSQRIVIANNKRSAASTKHKREIAKLLEEGKFEKAIIRVEHVIRDDYTTEAYEIIELMCDLLHERARYLTKNEMCPADLTEAVSTVLWASSRVDISELNGVKKQLSKKYGKEFCELCMHNSRGTVNEKVLEKLNISPPPKILIRSYLKEIAKEYCVEWDDESFPIREDGTSKNDFYTGYSISNGGASGLSAAYMESQPVPTPMTNDDLPPGYDDARFHTTTEVGGGNTHVQQPQPQKYVEEDAPTQQHMPFNQQQSPNPPNYQAPMPPMPPQPPQPPPSQQQQQQPSQGQHSKDTPQDTSSNGAPSYDDLMARFKNLKNN